jgi:hypothetical protein
VQFVGWPKVTEDKVTSFLQRAFALSAKRRRSLRESFDRHELRDHPSPSHKGIPFGNLAFGDNRRVA